MKTHVGAVDAAVAALEQNIAIGQEVDLRSAAEWAVGAVFRYMLPDVPDPPPTPPAAPAATASAGIGRRPPVNAAMREAAKMAGMTGDVCSDCGNLAMVRNGTCLKCTVCGSTTGCS